MTIAIRVHGLSKNFGDLVSLDQVSFQIAKGDVVALVGPNGAGKSTLINCIVGAIKPSQGSVQVLDRPIFEVPDLVHTLGFVRGSSGLDKGISVEKAMHVVALASGEDRKREEEFLQDCGIYYLKKQKIKNLSAGEKQRLAIAMSFLPGPKIMILDEPQSGLDADGIIWFRKLIKEFKLNGGTVLLATHLLSEVALIADKVIVLNKKLITFDDINHFLDEAGTSFEDSYLSLVHEKRTEIGG